MKQHAPDFFATKAAKPVPLQLITPDDLKGPKHKPLRDRLAALGFDGGAGQVVATHDAKGTIAAVYVGITRPLQTYALAPVLAHVAKSVAGSALGKLVFTLKGVMTEVEATNACVGFALGGYQFTSYKPKARKHWPKLVWPANADRVSAAATIDAIFMARDAINTPANDFGPDELVAMARGVADAHKAKITVISGDALLKNNYPLIHAVGRASTRPPCLIDLKWGNLKHPRVTLVGKGIIFDTGGLDIKPGSNMITMKKDMGGAAHVLALAHMIMSQKLPVQLRVLCAVAENSIAGNAFRPSDIITSRKGLTVEIGNTDAEGRLVLADGLAEACNDKPDLLIDMGTLTGASYIGPHLASMFARNDATADALLAIAKQIDDQMWRMPLCESYKPNMRSSIADIHSTGNNAQGGSIICALFLDAFVDAGIDWIHFDFYGWEATGRPGRPVGGTEFAIRALCALIAQRFATSA